MFSVCRFTCQLVIVTSTLLAICGIAQGDYAAAVLADQPLGYWRLNETQGDVAVNLGTAGAALNGTYNFGVQGVAGPDTVIGGTPVTGLGAGNVAFEVGPDESFVGVDASPLSDLTEFTMTGWVKPGARGATRIGLWGQNDSIEFGFIAPNQIQLWTPNGGALNWNFNPRTQIPVDTWVHIAGVGTGPGLELYVNGELVQRAAGGTYGASSFPFRIGGGGVYDATGNQFTGGLDEVAIYTKALSEDQVMAHLAAAITPGGDYAATVLNDQPIGYWRLNETEGDVAVNLGTRGAALNGTYNGGSRGVPGPDDVGGDAVIGLGAGNVAYEVGPDDAFVEVNASPLSNLTEFTFEGWVKPGPRDANRIGLWGQNDAMEFGFINPTRIQMWTPGGGALNWDFDPDFDLPDDEWFHVVAVGTGEEIQLFINGEMVQVGGSALPVFDTYGSSDFPFNIGGGGVYDATGNQLTGVVDEVAIWDRALTAEQIRAQFEAGVGLALPGDYDRDGDLDLSDVTLLIDAIPVVPPDLKFDANGDGTLNAADLNSWVKDLKRTWLGDANLDGEFNSGDLVQVFQLGKFETGSPAGWDAGDWNADKLFGTGDLVVAFQDGGFERGPRAAEAAVPEPGALALWSLVCAPWLLRRRRM